MRIGLENKLNGFNSGSNFHELKFISSGLYTSINSALAKNTNSIRVEFGKVASKLLGAFASYGILKTNWFTPLKSTKL